MKKPTITMFLAILLAVMPLAGCLRGEATLDMASDGTAQLTYKVLAAAVMEKSSKEEMAKLAAKGMRVETITEGGQNGFIARKQLSGLDELDKLGLFNSDDKLINKSRIDKGFFYDEQIFDLLYRGPKEEPNITPQSKQQRDNILAALDFTFTLNLPAAASEQNADTATADSRTLTWRLKMVSDTPIKAVAKVWHWGNIACTLIAALAAVWLYRKKAA